LSSFTIGTPAAGEHGTLISAEPGTDILDVPPEEISRHFKSTGVVLFRGFDLEIGRFQKLTERITGKFVSYDGGAAARDYVNGDPTVMTVSEPTHNYPVPLHGEMYYVENKPLVLWFYCVKPVEEGGQTTVGDGTRILEMLSDGARSLFTENRIKYIMIFAEGRWQKIFHTEDMEDVRRHCERNRYTMSVDEKDGSIVAEYVSDAIWPTKYGGARSFINNVFAITRWEWAGVPYRKVRLEDGSPIPREIIEELWKVEAEATRDVAWKPGDVLMVDNTRFLHGRRTFTDMSREIYVRLATEMII
jgi:alpha-ketoglutarate-dependent taurine dioxygenase